MKKTMLLLSVAAMMGFCAVAQNPKREFRGAWMHTVFQEQYSRQNTQENKNYLAGQLDRLQAAGVNAVIFQVRPQADALYPSKLEPWSRHLTGRAGVAPSPAWDPLQFMIDECHARGMELHAWLNPYRVTTSLNEKLPKNHIYWKHPERFLKYADGKIYFDPGLPENRAFIEDVVSDIITRYDVDAIHMDDYFYPYPVSGKDFPDNASFAKYGKGMSRGDWRRHNVDLLIEDLHRLIAEKKPWVRLGISPFGIWRNKASDARGSDTNGLENYDALYADVLLWTEKGWVDYMMPQLYWALDNKRASAEKLAHWWNANTGGRHLYIGQDTKVTMDKPDIGTGTDASQLGHKIRLSRELPNIQGNCWWPAYNVTADYKGIADSLAAKYQSTVALVPSYPWIDSVPPAEVSHLELKKRHGEKLLQWNAPKAADVMQEARAYVVYAFDSKTVVDLNDAKAVKAVVYKPEYVIPAGMNGKYRFVVTVLDRANNESPDGASVNVKL